MFPSDLEIFPWLAAAYAVAIYGFMLLFATWLLKFDLFRSALTKAPSRHGSIDGLRGLLACGVLVHHSFTAFVYFVDGHWRWSSSPIVNQLGQTTVALFFMITGFLFTLKVATPVVRWKALYLSRVARLVPLYAVIVCIVFVFVLVLSGGVLRQSPWALAREFVIWITFVVMGRPDINGYPLSWTLIAGVNWSLKYEVLFYAFGVPAIHLLTRLASPRAAWLATSLLLGALLLSRQWYGFEEGDALFATQFLGGIWIAQAYRLPTARAILQGSLVRVLAVAATGLLSMLMYSHTALAIVASIAIFAALAGDATLGGVLKTKGAIWLGDISYGIYLIHGLVLWCLLSTLSGAVDLRHISLAVYVPIVFAFSAVVVLLASLSYVKLEKPVMQRLAARMRARNGLAAAGSA